MSARDAFLAGLGYEPDPFQVRAMDSLDADASVLVAAPTGSGKTLVAEYAVARALSTGRRAFYTTPVKALSNQKYRDLCGVHGADRVGLVTGDNSVNPGARIVVMTTEVLRNMIYASSDRLDDLGVVVLDEVHFLQDAYRGPVWEEVIIQLDPEVQLVCLSATVSNAAEVGEWLTTVRGRTDVVVETTRPVELVHHFAWHDKASSTTVMHDTVPGGQVNGRVQRLLTSGAGGPAGRGRSRGGGSAAGRRSRFAAPSRPETVELLEDHGMLPAIVFIFSRAQCEDAVAACMREGLVLSTAEEEDEIRSVVERHCARLSDDDLEALGYDDFIADVSTGVACHHAGMIPVFKEAVEECFVRGLVKVVFATETLAVGINMPARAVVIEKITKYTGEHHSLLRASEFTQLTGRAGRRGLDDIGHAVVLWNPWVTFDQVAQLALSRSFRLVSAFRPTFNMAVNMVRRHSREGASHVLNLSFAQFQADRDIVTSEALLERRRRELSALERSHPRADGDAVDAGATDEDEDDGSGGATQVEAEIALRALRPGDAVLFDAANIRGRGLVVATASRRSGHRLTVLTPSRKLVDVTARDLRALPVRGSRVELPQPFEPARTEFVREAAARLARARIEEDAPSRPVEGAVQRSPVVPLSRAHEKRLRREIEQMERRAEARAGSVTARFMDVVDLLVEYGCVDGWSLTEKGTMLAGVFHESDLLVVEAASRGVFDALSPVDIAGVLSSLVWEPRGGSETSVRWPNDTVRNRVKRLEKVSTTLQQAERARGMTLHRPPDAGLAWETMQWASGRPLSRVLDPEVTPGDFVRTMRQLIDLCRQVATSVPSTQVSDAAARAADLLDRGVVASGGGGR